MVTVPAFLVFPLIQLTWNGRGSIPLILAFSYNYHGYSGSIPCISIDSADLEWQRQHSSNSCIQLDIQKLVAFLVLLWNSMDSAGIRGSTVILFPGHPASFAHSFVSGMQSFYFSESQDAIVLQTCQ